MRHEALGSLINLVMFELAENESEIIIYVAGLKPNILHHTSETTYEVFLIFGIK